MRGGMLSAVVVLATGFSPAQAGAAVWSAACYGTNSMQYLQTIGGDGYLHLGNSDGTFTTVKLKQTYFDGKVVCGSTSTKPKPNEIGAICADNAAQTIRVEYGSQIAAGVRPEKVATYCEAQVSIN